MIKNKSRINYIYLIISFIFGIIAGCLYFLYFLQQISMSIQKNLFILLYLIAFFTILIYFVIIKILIPHLRIYSPRQRALWLIGCLIGGIWLALAIPLPMPPPLATNHTLEIIATGKKNPLSQGKEVWVIGLFLPNGKQIPPSEFTLKGDWEIRDGIPLSYKNQPSQLYWQGRAAGDLRLVFVSHPWSGKVKVIWDGQEEVVDLYSSIAETKEILVEGTRTSPSKYIKILGCIGEGSLLGLILLVLSTWMIYTLNIKNNKLFTNVVQKFREYFKVNYLIKYLIIPIALLILYSGSFIFISSRLLPEGVNYVFVSKIIKYLLILMSAICFTVILMFMFDKNVKISIKKSTAKLCISDLIFILLPLTTIVQYVINNQSLLSPLDSLYVIAFFIIISLIYIYIIPAFLGFVSSTRLLMTIGLAFVVTIINMASLSQYYHWFDKGSINIQLIYFGVVFIISWYLFRIKNRKVLSIILLIYFIANSGLQWVSKNNALAGSSYPDEENQLLSMVKEKSPVFTPNIYLLVYDSYVVNETMLGYGIDNSLQEDFLTDRGFVIYPHTYSIGASTIASMTRVLNASYNVTSGSRKEVAGDGAVHKTLKYLGYKTYGIFPYDYMFQGVGSSYDFSIPKMGEPPYVRLISAVLLGEFRFDIGFKKIPYDQFVDTKRYVLMSVSEERVFIYSHTSFPNHSQNSGACLPNEIDLYKERLAVANNEMKEDVKTIIKYDPNAIVIVAGDHGPYLTKNCTITGDFYDISEISRLDIQDRYGSFLAIRWPTDDYEKYDDITVLQDIFPSIFAYLFNDIGFLKLKVKPEISGWTAISGVEVKNGIIYGGIDDGEPLYLSSK